MCPSLLAAQVVMTDQEGKEQVVAMAKLSRDPDRRWAAAPAHPGTSHAHVAPCPSMPIHATCWCPPLAPLAHTITDHANLPKLCQCSPEAVPHEMLERNNAGLGTHETRTGQGPGLAMLDHGRACWTWGSYMHACTGFSSYWCWCCCLQEASFRCPAARRPCARGPAIHMRTLPMHSVRPHPDRITLTQPQQPLRMYVPLPFMHACMRLLSPAGEFMRQHQAAIAELSNEMKAAARDKFGGCRRHACACG